MFLSFANGVADNLCGEFPIHFDGDLEKFQDECDALARMYIDTFFATKSFFCGGPIPSQMIRSMTSVNTVVSSPFMSGMDMIYQVIGTKACRPPSEFDSVEHGELDIFMVLNMIAELRKATVPVEYQAGMILLWLKFCKGFQIPAIKYDVSHLIKGTRAQEKEKDSIPADESEDNGIETSPMME